MGLASRPSPGHAQVDAPGGIGIIETIAMKESLGIAHAPGVVAVLDAFPAAEPEAFVGQSVRLRTPAGRSFPAQVDAVRDHGTTISFFFRGPTRADIPVGSRVEFDSPEIEGR
jgi:hypothetical protein